MVSTSRKSRKIQKKPKNTSRTYLTSTKMPTAPINYLVKPVDTFINSSASTLEANPSETLITMKYDFHTKPTAKKNKKTGEDQYSTSVEFKTSNPSLDLHYKYTTNKTKELSRLLSALGPNGVTMNLITNKVLKKKNMVRTTSKVNKPKKSTYLKQLGKSSKKPVKYSIKHDQLNKVPGAGTLLANTEIKKHVEVKNTVQSSNSKSKKKSKNKNKNR